MWICRAGFPPNPLVKADGKTNTSRIQKGQQGNIPRGDTWGNLGDGENIELASTKSKVALLDLFENVNTCASEAAMHTPVSRLLKALGLVMRTRCRYRLFQDDLQCWKHSRVRSWVRQGVWHLILEYSELKRENSPSSIPDVFSFLYIGDSRRYSVVQRIKCAVAAAAASTRLRIAPGTSQACAGYGVTEWEEITPHDLS
ncbi:hypothetical protein RRG08_018992 [Elysia crispata]|uniref:Uncharacterized protein n=1 Tax=Elysia crispata TaxID=231223 RepID=A0AAE1DSF8_9GAST|nr:hypothetical protein RRG08_018992 [Elysia crispata]